LGPKFGKNIQAVSKTILNMAGEQIHLLEIGETLNFEVNNFSFDLSLVDIEVFYQDIEGWQVGSESGYTIALDISINDKLKNEGISREIVNKIQNLRKDSNFNVSDKIIINIVNNNLIDEALKDNLDYVKNETLAVEINFVDKLDSPREFEFDNIKLELEIKKIT
jgi:isoleucyl-tRNA synthetase